MSRADAPQPILGRRRLYLMRHGHVDYFAPGLEDFTQVPLTEEGQGQARRAGAALKDIAFDVAFHSGLPRTRETAALVLTAQNGTAPEAEALSGFAELRSGTYEAQTPEELAARLAFAFEEAGKPGAAFLPGGETFADAKVRIVAGFDELVLGTPWRTALVVAHEGVNKVLLSTLTGGGLDNARCFEQDLGCINVLDIDCVPDAVGRPSIERVTLKLLNATPYDDVKNRLNRTSLEVMFNIDFDGHWPRDFPQ